MYSVTSRSPVFRMYLSKSTKVSVPKCNSSTESRKYSLHRMSYYKCLHRYVCLKIADLQAHNASHRDAL